MVLCPQGAVAGVDVRGSAPGTRETDLLHPLSSVKKVHAILLAGGSAFGLAAADGVMRWLEECGHGYPTSVAVVPIVPAAILYDLAIGRADVRPDAAAGYAACETASRGPLPDGNVGAGVGATVGKMLGFERATKAGLGTASKSLGDGTVVAALAVVNALGEVCHPQTQQVLAGARNARGDGFADSTELAEQALSRGEEVRFANENTTLAIVATNVALTKAGAEEAVAATQKAGVTLGLGYNRRLHPSMVDLRNRIKSGALGTILHVEADMTFPNALFLKSDQWRASREETPCGGLTPMGVHAVDAMIDLCGEIDEVFCMSFRRVVKIDADDTTSILFRMKEGMSGYLGTMTATGGGFSFQVFGSKGSLRLEGMTHIAGAPSEERRNRLFGTCKFQPVKGPLKTWQADAFDVSRAVLDAFAKAAGGGPAYPIPLDEMIHGAAVTEAIVKSAASGKMEKIA